MERSIGLLAQIRYFVSAKLLRTVYFAIFDLYLRYECQIWGQNKNVNTNEISKLQDKAIRVISFKDCNTPCGPLYSEMKIIKFFDLITFHNCVFIAEHLNQNLPSSFGNYFTYMANQHHHNMLGTVRKLVNVTQCKTLFMEPIQSQLNQFEIGIIFKKITFEFNRENVITPKLMLTVKEFFLTSYLDND